jgi:NAD(P)-dependent dehydrogenase (short-subunit alcohol dehydrogenase family)
MGLATAKAFAEARASVVPADRHGETVRAAAEDLIAAGHKALAIRCDVAIEDQVAAMVQQTVSTFGRLDAAFNNAGTQSPIAETSDASGEEEVAHSLPAKGRPSGSPARSASTRCSNHTRRHARPVPASRSSPGPGRRGTPTLWGKP